MNYDDLKPEVKRLVDAADAKAQSKPDPNEPKAFKKEADFQREAERFLELCGFRRRTPKEIQASDRGLWYIHMAEAKKNPIILDLLLLDSNRGRYIEIELKVDGGKLSPEQRCLVLRNEGKLCYNMGELRQTVSEWYNGHKEEENT